MVKIALIIMNAMLIFIEKIMKLLMTGIFIGIHTVRNYLAEA